MAARQYHLKFGGNAAASVDAYAEYRRIVGDDDGGVLFTPEQYEAYKKRVLPIRMKNRLYTAWTNSTGMDCKLIGPESMCFCNHRYRGHSTDFEKIPTERPILLPCKVKGCGCTSFHYVPRNGSQPIRCTCKHFSDTHSARNPHKCKEAKCGCSGFSSSYTCGCGEPYYSHDMIVETKEERLARGHPIGQDVPYQAMGGITGFSSLLEGYMRLDPSGLGLDAKCIHYKTAGAPSKEFLEQPITSNDHPFLRANVQSIKAHKMHQRALKGQDNADYMDEDLAERMSAMKRPGESDMDYYERRYQERQKAERERSHARVAAARKPAVVGKRTAPAIKPAKK